MSYSCHSIIRPYIIANLNVDKLKDPYILKTRQIHLIKRDTNCIILYKMHLNFLTLNLSEFEQIYQYCHKFKYLEKFKSNFNQKFLANQYNVLDNVQMLNVDIKMKYTGLKSYKKLYS